MALPVNSRGPGQTVLPLLAVMAVRTEEEQTWTITA